MGNTPLYQVITQDILEQIEKGHLPPGHRLDSEFNLAARYGVSRMTVRQALGELESEGRLVRRPGSGTFVKSPDAISRETNAIAPFHQELGLRAHEITTDLEVQEVAEPPAWVAERLFTGAGAAATHLVRVRKYKQRPIAVQESWLPYLLAPQLSRDPLVGGSLYRSLKQLGMEVAAADQRVTATVADDEHSRLLHLPTGSPLIATQRVAYTKARDVIEVAQCVMLPEFPIVIHLTNANTPGRSD